MPPSRSTHRAFWWAPTHDTRVLSGNHATGPLLDFWAWNGTEWSRTPLTEAECPERKNAAVAVDDVTQRLYVFGGTWSGYPRDGGSYTIRVMGDFRSWDGTTWRDEAGDAGAPSARGGAALGYDSERRQLILFGGSDNQTANNETWMHDGQRWTQLSFDAGTAPSPRLNMHLVFDQARKRLVLFGGQVSNAASQAVNLQDTWEWDGQRWSDVTGAAPAPPGRGHSAMTYDRSRQQVVMMGGARHFSPIPPGSALDDLWEWNGTQWSPVTVTGPKPGPRTAATLSFDPDRGRLILYGGFDVDKDLSEHWELSGQSWERRDVLPLPRSAAAFGQRGPNEEALLFGGYISAGGKYLADTWRWQGGKWVEVSGARPSPRSDASLAFHGALALLVGGRYGSAAFSPDSFALGPGSSDWVALPGPTPRSHAAIGHDPKRSVTVVFGGVNATGRIADTWVFNGTGWAQLTTTGTPPALKDAALRFDPVRQQLVLLGGSRAGGVVSNDAWAFDGTNWQPLAAVTSAPSPRAWNALAFDSKGRLWSFGGYDGTTVFDDASRLEHGVWTAVTPVGPAARFSARLLDLGAHCLLLHLGLPPLGFGALPHRLLLGLLLPPLGFGAFPLPKRLLLGLGLPALRFDPFPLSARLLSFAQRALGLEALLPLPGRGLSPLALLTAALLLLPGVRG